MALSLSGLPALAQARPFSGNVYATPGAKVELRVGSDPSKGGIFTAFDVPLSCDNDTAQLTDFPKLRVHFLDHDVFQGHLYRRSANGDQQFFKVRGHIDGRKAAGTIFALSDVAAEVGLDCYIVPKRWRASR
jgi:hypothetical protein